MLDAKVRAAWRSTRQCFLASHGDRRPPATCTWLDSQAAIEDNLGAKAIIRTALQPACPFVMWRG